MGVDRSCLFVYIGLPESAKSNKRQRMVSRLLYVAYRRVGAKLSSLCPPPNPIHRKSSRVSVWGSVSKSVSGQARVADHGEVFTAEREVKAMCDLVKNETERIEFRFLEPACGQGAFLIEILRRKLAVVSSRYAATQSEWERHAAIAVSSLYGIDILADNVTLCRNHLYDTFLTAYRALFPKTMKPACCHAVRYLLATNILWGDALTLQTPDESARPIVFAEWSDSQAEKSRVVAGI